MSIENPRTLPALEIVVAAARNGVIGRGNALPWHLPEDLRHFKRLTLGHPILMGRRTYESIGRPLPGRTNLVLSRDAGLVLDGVRVVHSLAAVRDAVPDADVVMVIGGGELYRQCLPLARALHLTEVDADIEGDVRFPAWSPHEWRELSRERHAADERHAHAYSFVTYERVAA